jgi:integrase
MPTIITSRDCERKATTRVPKIYDSKCRGLYLDRTPTKGSTFWFRYTNPINGKREHIKLGVYVAGHYTVDSARADASRLRVELQKGVDIAAKTRMLKTHTIKRAKTVGEIIDLYIASISAPERKADNEVRARVESWKEVARVLDRFVRPRLGRTAAGEVTKHDVAALSNDIVEGGMGVPSVSNARHTRKALSGLFRWASEAGRDYVSTSPCVNLPPLPKEHPRERHLSEAEIRTLWHGLDRDDMPWDRRTRLAIKFALTTMLRSGEFLSLHVSEIVDLDGPDARVDIPLKRVKKRRVIQQPLSSLAIEIIREAVRQMPQNVRQMPHQQYVFQTPQADKPLHRHCMATALRGRPDKGIAGICEILGLAPFTPHDLRRTAATLAGNRGFDVTRIARCLDHQSGKSVTWIYDRSDRLKEKREVLDAVAAELRRIIGPQLRLVA